MRLLKRAKLSEQEKREFRAIKRYLLVFALGFTLIGLVLGLLVSMIIFYVCLGFPVLTGLAYGWYHRQARDLDAHDKLTVEATVTRKFVSPEDRYSFELDKEATRLDVIEYRLHSDKTVVEAHHTLDMTSSPTAFTLMFEIEDYVIPVKAQHFIRYDVGDTLVVTFVPELNLIYEIVRA